jgi:CDP-diacylglycerol pyrophosphatase
MSRIIHLLPLALLLVVVAAVTQVYAANPSALWHIVHGRCVPDQTRHHDPAPCTVVNLSGGYAVLKDLVGKTQFLLIPTARVSGIEDKAILAPNAPNYFADAWQVRHEVDKRAGHDLPRQDFALAINSIYGRTQNQLHIHIDCIRPDVRAALALHAAEIGPHWSRFPVKLSGHTYRAMRIAQARLDAINPFRLLAADVPPADMRLHTLVLAGALFDGRPGFVLLDGIANLAVGNRGSGEELEDHSCVVAR